MQPPLQTNSKTQIKPRNDFEKLILQQEGNVEWNYMSDQDLDAMFLTRGCKPEDLAACRKVLDDSWNELAALSGGRIHSMGIKPEQSGEDYQLFPIPNSNMALRIFDGGMEKYSQYILDFFDLETKTPINNPPGFKLLPFGISHSKLPNGIRSWEAAYGINSDKIILGEEKFGVSEGSQWYLYHEDKELMRFAVPERPRAIAKEFVLPVSGRG